MDSQYIALGILIPFVGTSLGSACVYFLKGNKTTGGNAPVIPPDVEKGLTGFAAGAMIYVVVEELIPETAEGEHSNWGVLLFAVGFTVMMALDVALG